MISDVDSDQARRRRARRRVRSISGSAAAEAGGRRRPRCRRTADGRCTRRAAAGVPATSTRRDGTIENTQSRAGFGHVGVGAGRATRATSAPAIGYDDTKYGIPIVEEGNIQLTPRRHRSRPARGCATSWTGRSTSVRVLVRRTGATGTTSWWAKRSARSSRTTRRDFNVLGQAPAAVGRLTGTIGGSGLTRAFSADGEEALSPPVDEQLAALHLQELTVAARDAAVRRHASSARRSRPEAGLPRSRLHQRIGIRRPAAPSGRGRRRADVRGQPGARGAQSGARGALFLRPAPRQLRVRDWQCESRLRERRSASTCRSAGASRASSGEVTLLPQQHRQLHLPESDQRGGVRRALPGRGGRRVPVRRVRRADSLLQGVEAHADVEISAAG